jgi:methyl-accepting chemotaxis protein
VQQKLLEPLLGQAREKVRLHGQELVAQAGGARAAMRSIVGLTTALVGVASVVAGLLLALGISRPMARLADAMTRIAQGDLDTEVPETARRDEVGTMARLVQHFKDGVAVLHQRMGMLSHHAQAVVDSSKSLGVVSGSLSGAAQQSTTMASAVSGDTAQLSQAVATIAASAEEMCASIAEIARTTAIATKAGDEAVEQSRLVAPIFERLGQLNQEIGGVGRGGEGGRGVLARRWGHGAGLDRPAKDRRRPAAPGAGGPQRRGGPRSRLKSTPRRLLYSPALLREGERPARERQHDEVVVRERLLRAGEEPKER